MKLNFAVLVLLFCANVSAQTFHGDWSSNQISVSSKKDGEFVNCKSDLSLDLTETHLTIGSPALIHCDGMTFVAESRPLAISEGGVLTSYSGARGTITDTKIEIFQPVFLKKRLSWMLKLFLS